jgi:hypothetical protein
LVPTSFLCVVSQVVMWHGYIGRYSAFVQIGFRAVSADVRVLLGSASSVTFVNRRQIP